MDNGIDQATRNKIALGRSLVRQVVTYLYAGIGVLVIGWGLIWMGDRSLATAGLTIVGMLLAYWFGERSGSKNTDAK